MSMFLDRKKSSAIFFDQNCFPHPKSKFSILDEEKKLSREEKNLDFYLSQNSARNPKIVLRTPCDERKHAKNADFETSS